MAMRYTSTVELHIQAKPLSSVCHLHRAGDATIFISASPHEIRAPIDDKIDMLLQTKDVFRLQQWCLNQLS